VTLKAQMMTEEKATNQTHQLQMKVCRDPYYNLAS